MACGCVKALACAEMLAEEAMVEAKEAVSNVPREGIDFGAWGFEAHVMFWLVFGPGLRFVAD